MKDGPALTGKRPRTIYKWVQKGRLATRLEAEGHMVILTKALLCIEPTIRSGRPRGRAATR